ncbi:peptidase inhibitor family I36 protein [Terrabacter sp. LjRoot27]|uniref:peptidase inhibitor family I36 protein n=1 Tax=Terrabacter sp. LjRoot27 TaxID=3342306 RepID=UPI003ECFC1EB
MPQHPGRLGSAGAALALAISGLTALAGATPAHAADRNGVCETGEFCYYYNSDHAGSVSDFTSSVADYGTDQPGCYDFKTSGLAGYGQCIKNNAASVWNRSSDKVQVFYNSDYGGAVQEIAAGAKVNLSSALKNQNASHRFVSGTPVPSSAPSYYVSNQDTAWANAKGCAMGNADEAQAGTQTRIVVLDFGRLNHDADGVWRLSYFSGTDRTPASAGALAVAMGKGYDSCVGADTSSLLRIGLGTNNSSGTISSAAGKVMAQAALDADAGLAAFPQATVWGANDFEAWGADSTAHAKARSWVDGYNSVAGARPLVNYGSADGCPSSSIPTDGSCNAGLNAYTIWYVSTQGAARPLPEIYTPTGTQAKQWKYLSLYSVVNKGFKLTFPGVMSQAGACAQSGGCPGTDNSPSSSWSQLDDQVDSDSRTATNPGNPTNIYWQ